MEKKPKPNRRAEGTWHGGSQIAPAKKVSSICFYVFFFLKKVLSSKQMSNLDLICTNC